MTWIYRAVVFAVILMITKSYRWDTCDRTTCRPGYEKPILLFIWGNIYGFCLNYVSDKVSKNSMMDREDPVYASFVIHSDLLTCFSQKYSSY